MNPPTGPGLPHLPEEDAEADQKALDLLKNSPYAQKLNAPGLFLREVVARAPALHALLTPHLGTGFTNHKGAVDRMLALMNSAPVLDSNKVDQIAALPLGGRIKLNAWDDRLEMLKITPMPVNPGPPQDALGSGAIFSPAYPFRSDRQPDRNGERRHRTSKQ